jgi:hypothetical protein
MQRTVMLINQQRFWICNSAFGHATELSIFQQCCWLFNSTVDHATVLLFMQRCCRWCNSVFDQATVLSAIIWQQCQSYDIAVNQGPWQLTALLYMINRPFTWSASLIHLNELLIVCLPCCSIPISTRCHYWRLRCFFVYLMSRPYQAW